MDPTFQRYVSQANGEIDRHGLNSASFQLTLISNLLDPTMPRQLRVRRSGAQRVYVLDDADAWIGLLSADLRDATFG